MGRLADALGKKTGGIDIGFGWRVKAALRLTVPSCSTAIASSSRSTASADRCLKPAKAHGPMAETAAAVIGAGAWGTALATMLAQSGRRTTLCVRRAAHLAALTEGREIGLSARHQTARLAAFDGSMGAGGGGRGFHRGSDSVAIRASSGKQNRAGAAPGSYDRQRNKGIEEDSLETMTAMLAEFAPASAGLAVLSVPDLRQKSHAANRRRWLLRHEMKRWRAASSSFCPGTRCESIAAAT